jgi:hypothetical protein
VTGVVEHLPRWTDSRYKTAINRSMAATIGIATRTRFS